MIYTEFEVFHQGLLKDIGNISESGLQLIKTKSQSTCEKNAKIKVPYNYKSSMS